jgi:single-strand DNA-binding protein
LVSEYVKRFDMNIVVLRGTLSSDAVQRSLPSGDWFVTYEVTTRDGEGGARSVPVSLQRGDAPVLAKGTEVVVLGSVRRRFFAAGGATGSRTEVQAVDVLRASAVKKIEKALHRVAIELSAVG